MTNEREEKWIRLLAKIAAIPAEPVPATRPKVVIVDDNESVLKALSIFLGKSYDVVVCSNPEAAPALVLRERPRAVVLDVKMPVRDGFWVCGEIRKQDPDVPVLFNSAYQDVMSADDAVGRFKNCIYVAKGDMAAFKAGLSACVSGKVARAGA
jgi:CheY-like chemotaxis protein